MRLRDLCSTYILPLVASGPPPAAPIVPTAQGSGMRQARMMRQEDQGPAVPEPPTEEQILTLMSIGFTREQVMRALAQTRNNLERASNLLIDQASHQ